MRSFYPICLTCAVLAGPATASAAEIRVDRSCYLQTGSAAPTVDLTGSGFTPGAAFQVLLDGRPILGGTGTVDPNGTIRGRVTAPLLGGADEERHTIDVQEGANAARARFTVTRFLADFAPSRGNPATLRVRFEVAGFGLATPRPNVYLHYVRPNGRLRQTIRLGRARGSCGRIARTARRRLFPFQAEPGRWRLQFDTSRRYRRGTERSDFLYYAVGVRVTRQG